MPSVLIIGASRGIGLELARQYAQAGWDVHATYREKGSRLDKIPDVRTYQLDVTNSHHLQALKEQLGDTAIDLLICNAGVYGQEDDFLGNVDEQSWLNTLKVNTIAPLMICQALVGNVARSKMKMIAAMSSKMGSMDDNGSGGSYVYRSSKAGLNAVMKSLSIDLVNEFDINVIILHPGWVITDMTGPDAQITTEESVSGLRVVIAGCTEKDRGKFFDYQGNEIPW